MTAPTLSPVFVAPHTPDTRHGLLTLATWWNEGQFDHASTSSVAAFVRVFAPSLANRPDDYVMTVFLDLANEVRVLAEFEAGQLTWEDVLPDATGTDREGQALDAAQDRVNATLAELTGRTA